jgi:predicted nucleic acid-binding protein
MLGRLPGFKFVVTPEAVAEIVRPDQQEQVEGALRAGVLRLEQLSDPEALALLADLRSQMGAGEAASLALAASEGWAIASDEQRAFRREAVARLGQGRIMTTPGLYVVAIRFGLLSVEEADADKATLAACKFKMDFSSFRGLLPGGRRRGAGKDRRLG